MKTVNAFVIILSSLFLISCKTNPTNGGKEIAVNNAGITGEWLWKRTSGGFGGTNTTPSGNDVSVLRITIDSSFVEVRNDTTTFSDQFTTYSYGSDDSLHSRKVIDFIRSKRFNLFIDFVSTDSLILSDTYIDGYTYVYSRIM